jgi:hypothetical protein
MELITTIQDFVKEATYRHLAPETHIRVIIDEPEITSTENMKEEARLPIMTPEEQVRLLNLLPNDYDQDASEELIHIIETSHTNTDIIEL